jgi:hypothetical protein
VPRTATKSSPPAIARESTVTPVTGRLRSAPSSGVTTSARARRRAIAA